MICIISENHTVSLNTRKLRKLKNKIKTKIPTEEQRKRIGGLAILSKPWKM